MACAGLGHVCVCAIHNGKVHTAAACHFSLQIRLVAIGGQVLP
eukprot:SAG25_NODE_14487_length_254_cov_1.000000_1_plen_42_part_10